MILQMTRKAFEERVRFHVIYKQFTACVVAQRRDDARADVLLVEVPVALRIFS